MKITPELSIIVTSYKNPAVLKLCLVALQKEIKNVSYEIIVADSATEEGTYDLIRESFPDVCFIPNEENLGFGGLVNQGLELVKGEYFFIINHDIVIKDGTISGLLNFLKKNKEVGMVGPKLINFDNSVQPSSFRFYSLATILYRRTFLGRFSFAKKHLQEFKMKKEVETDGSFDVDWLMGSAMMVTKEVVEKVGGMDRRYFMYFEDVDWCWRFWEAGYRVVYFPKVRVFHYHGKASAGKTVFASILFNKYTRIHIQSGIKFFLKYLGKKNPCESFQNKKQ